MKSPANTLIIGYGNSLREDDGFGIKVVELLGDLPNTDTLQNYQLTPEMCEQFPHYKHIIFIDVSVKIPAGVFASPLPSVADPFTHAVLPWQLIKYASDLYGFRGDYFVFSVGGFSFDLKEELSDLLTLRAKELSGYLKGFLNQI